MKNSTRFYLFSTLFASSVSLVSCSLSDELDKLNSIDSIEATGSFSANVLNETWVMKDLLPAQKLNLTENEDGSYSFGYESNSSYTLDKVKFPSTSSETQSLPLSPLNYLDEYKNMPTGAYYTTPPLVLSIEIPKPEIGNNPFATDYKIKAVRVRNGAEFNLALDINGNFETEITIAIPSLTKDGIPYTKTFIPSGSQTNVTINNLEGYVLSTDPDVKAIIQPRVKKMVQPISGDIKAKLTMNISDQAQSIEGYFGEVQIPVDPVDFPFSMPEDLKGSDDSQLTIKEVTITLKVNQNGFKVPVDLDLSTGNLIYYKGNANPKPIEIIPLEQSADGTTFKFKVKNINVLNIEKFVLNPIVTANKGITSGNNYITDTASIDYDVSVSLPLDIEAENLSFEQEGDNILFDDKTEINETDFEFKDGRIILKGAINSEIPMGASLQVYYKDNSEDTVYQNTLLDQPVTVAANGSSNFIASITKEKYDLLKRYKYQVMKVTLNGSGAISSSQKISVKLGVAAKGTIKTKI